MITGNDGWDSSFAASPGRQNLHLATLFPASLGGTDSLQYGYFNGFHWTFEVLEYSGSSARGLGRRSRSTSEINLTSRSVAPMESRIPVASFWRRVFQLLDLERIVSLIHSKHFFNRLLTLLLDYDDTPTLADSDARRIVFARRSTPLSGEDHGTWKKRTVLSSSEDLYMGTAILELDWLGYPVIAFWQRSEEHPNGLVRLASSRPREPKPFHRGDANDDGRSDMGDALRILDFLFLGGERPGCLEAADTANMGSLNLNAPIFLLNYLFKGGQALPPPGPASEPCGFDPDPSGSRGDLGCDTYESCG